MADAAEGGHIHCVKYLQQQHCPWKEDACSRAAMAGHLFVLMYLHRNGCPWNTVACSKAAYLYAKSSGQVAVMQFLKERGQGYP